MALGLLLFAGCASMPVYERNTETRIIVIREKIEDGQKTGVLTADQSGMYMATLKDIRADYGGMKGKRISKEEREALQGRLDVLDRVVYKALTPPKKKSEEPEDTFWERIGRDLGILDRTEEPKPPTNGERIVKVQKMIDDGRNGGSISLSDGDAYQARADYIRTTYLKMMNGDGTPSPAENEVIARLLTSLEADLNHQPTL
ncbi:MAG TPA: hypothetical protein VMJ66_05275 [Geobacteraceae bacterium]|nr:hypothetical protein [Geobacteraceae bacterium]